MQSVHANGHQVKIAARREAARTDIATPDSSDALHSRPHQHGSNGLTSGGGDGVGRFGPPPNSWVGTRGRSGMDGSQEVGLPTGGRGHGGRGAERQGDAGNGTSSSEIAKLRGPSSSCSEFRDFERPVDHRERQQQRNSYHPESQGQQSDGFYDDDDDYHRNAPHLHTAPRAIRGRSSGASVGVMVSASAVADGLSAPATAESHKRGSSRGGGDRNTRTAATREAYRFQEESCRQSHEGGGFARAQAVMQTPPPRGANCQMRREGEAERGTASQLSSVASSGDDCDEDDDGNSSVSQSREGGSDASLTPTRAPPPAGPEVAAGGVASGARGAVAHGDEGGGEARGFSPHLVDKGSKQGSIGVTKIMRQGGGGEDGGGLVDVEGVGGSEEEKMYLPAKGNQREADGWQMDSLAPATAAPGRAPANDQHHHQAVTSGRRPNGREEDEQRQRGELDHRSREIRGGTHGSEPTENVSMLVADHRGHVAAQGGAEQTNINYRYHHTSTNQQNRRRRPTATESGRKSSDALQEGDSGIVSHGTADGFEGLQPHTGGSRRQSAGGPLGGAHETNGRRIVSSDSHSAPNSREPHVSTAQQDVSHHRMKNHANTAAENEDESQHNQENEANSANFRNRQHVDGRRGAVGDGIGTAATGEQRMASGDVGGHQRIHDEQLQRQIQQQQQRPQQHQHRVSASVDSKTGGVAPSPAAAPAAGGERNDDRSPATTTTMTSAFEPLIDAQDLRLLPISRNLDDYEDLGEIGRGQFGTVHKVRLKTCPVKHFLTWKCLNYHTMPEREKRQLQQEVLLLQNLSHPNVVKCVERINDRRRALLYLIMEFCEDGDLGAYLELTVRRGFPLPESQVLSWFVQLVGALDYCHTLPQKVFHRDLKPQNILLCNDYKRVKLGDFGLAKILQPTQSCAQTHVGTPYYMSPEVLDHKRYNSKSDIWALGCLLYEIATGRPPYGAATSYDHLKQLVSIGVYEELPNFYSQEFRACVNQMLAKDPKNRPSTRMLKSLPIYCRALLREISDENADLKRKLTAARARLIELDLQQASQRTKLGT